MGHAWSHIPLRIRLQAIFLIADSKKGMPDQLHRTLGVTLKFAWFLGYRGREAMEDDTGLLGGGNSIGEADEVHLGPKLGHVKEKRGG